MSTPTYLNRPKRLTQNSDRDKTAGFTLGLLASLGGGLLLGEVLKLGLFSGTGGSIFAELSTTLALTGFGLISLSLTCFIVACYCLAKSAVIKPNDALEIQIIYSGPNKLSSVILEFLKENDANTNNNANVNEQIHVPRHCKGDVIEIKAGLLSPPDARTQPAQNSQLGHNSSLFFAKSDVKIQAVLRSLVSPSTPGL